MLFARCSLLFVVYASSTEALYPKPTPAEHLLVYVPLLFSFFLHSSFPFPFFLSLSLFSLLSFAFLLYPFLLLVSFPLASLTRLQPKHYIIKQPPLGAKQRDNLKTIVFQIDLKIQKITTHQQKHRHNTQTNASPKSCVFKVICLGVNTKRHICPHPSNHEFLMCFKSPVEQI